jgi:suppressor of tumorigenicity protein 13
MEDIDIDSADDDDVDVKGTEPEHDELDEDIVESDIEIEGEILEPDNEPPQKVLASAHRSY